MKVPFRHSISRGELDRIAELAEKNLRELSDIVLKGLKPPAGAYAFFNHSSHALSRLGDCKKILKRLYRERYDLVELAILQDRAMPNDWPAGTPYPEEVQKIMRKEAELNGLMQLDFESLYIFGGILLDQWALQAIAVGNIPLKKKGAQGLNPFIDLLLFLENGNKSVLDSLWESLKSKMLWLHYHMRFYRNRFIVHANRPWQRGTTHGVYGENFNLHTPTPPGWIDDEKLDEEIKKLIRLAPERLQKAPEDHWERARPGALIERVFDNIGNIENKEDRKKVADIFGEKGGSTPTFQILAKNLLTFVAEGASILCDIAKNNLSNIDLGRPHKTSDEMWRSRTS